MCAAGLLTDRDFDPLSPLVQPSDRFSLDSFHLFLTCRWGWIQSHSAEDAGPFWARHAQVLDWFIVHGENAVCCAAHYAAGIAAITNYQGAGPAAEFEVRLHMLAAKVLAFSKGGSTWLVLMNSGS